MDSEFVLNPFIGSTLNGKLSILCETEERRLYVLTVENVKRHYTVDKEVYIEGVTCVTLEMPTDEDGDYNIRFIRDKIVRHTLNVKYNPVPKRIIFCSGDRIEDEPHTPLWKEMASSNPDICVHISNNIYGDAAFASAMNFARRFKDDKDQTVNLAIQKYSTQYQRTFNRWSETLGGICNLFGLGEHEIYNDSDSLWDTYDMAERTVSEAALYSYDIYQGTSMRNMKTYKNGRSWVQTWTYENALVCLAFFDNPLGIEEICRLSVFNDIPPETSYLIACTAVPPVPSDIPMEFTSQFLDLLWKWRNDKVGRRVVIVSGSTHYSIKGRICRSDGAIIQLLIASPITTQPSVKGKHKGSNLHKKHLLSEEVGKDGKYMEYTYQIDEVGYRRCFGIVDLTKIDFHISLIYSDHMFPTASNVIARARVKRAEKYQ